MALLSELAYGWSRIYLCIYLAMVICIRRFRCCTSTSWREKHFNFPTLVTWRSFLTSRAETLAGDAAGQGAGLLVASDCAGKVELQPIMVLLLAHGKPHGMFSHCGRHAWNASAWKSQHWGEWGAPLVDKKQMWNLLVFFRDMCYSQ